MNTSRKLICRFGGTDRRTGGKYAAADSMSCWWSEPLAGLRRRLVPLEISDMARAENSGCLYIIDGYLYSHTKKDLESILVRYFESNRGPSAIRSVQRFVNSCDGEFFVVAYHPVTQRCLVFNDSLGRLPLFWTGKDLEAGFFVGRDQFSMRKLAELNTPDVLGVASRLLLSYPLDERTEWQGLTCFPESTLVTINLKDEGVSVWSADNLDYAVESRGAFDLAESARELVRLLYEASANRARASRGSERLVTLSGGLDSRIVAITLKRVAPDCHGITRQDHLAEADELKLAKEVARRLSLRHSLVPAGELQIGTVLELIAATDGNLSIRLAHMLQFLHNVKDKVDAAEFVFTGDGGDKTLAPFGVATSTTIDREQAKLLHQPTSLAITTVLGMLKIGLEEWKDYIFESIKAQPGDSAFEKARALIVRQRSRRWLALGEDRNRELFWSTSPFWAPDFFRLAFSIPDEHKVSDRLYREVLTRLHGQVGQLPRATNDRWLFENVGRVITQSLTKPFPRLRQKLRSRRVLDRGWNLPNGYSEFIKVAQSRNQGLWGICDPMDIKQSIVGPGDRTFKERLLSMLIVNACVEPK